MNQRITRREFGHSAGALAAGLGLSTLLAQQAWGFAEEPMYKISLAEWSLHKSLFAGKVKHLDFAKISKEEFGIDGVEYVNQFFKGQAQDQAYLQDMKTRAEDHGVTSLLIMVDGEGALGHADEAKRTEAVDNHKKWVEAAKFLGCHSVRVNAQSSGSYDEQIERAADGLSQLGEFAKPLEISIIVENHGGLSSNGKWLAAVMEKASSDNVGTLPDFGNFRVSRDEEYDRYQGVAELMPYARAVSAKSHDFDDQGNEIHTDYLKMMKIVLDAGYRGYVGIEYEGSKLSEPEGIKATKALLERVRDELSS